MSKVDLSHAIVLIIATHPTTPTAPIRLFTSSVQIAFTRMSLTAERPMFLFYPEALVLWHWGSVAPGS
jgi:hypothetical protein